MKLHYTQYTISYIAVVNRYTYIYSRGFPIIGCNVSILSFWGCKCENKFGCPCYGINKTIYIIRRKIGWSCVMLLISLLHKIAALRRTNQCQHLKKWLLNEYNHMSCANQLLLPMIQTSPPSLFRYTRWSGPARRAHRLWINDICVSRQHRRARGNYNMASY